MKRLWAIALAGLTPVSILAADHFWVIGGGPSPHASEAQIEFNVNWVVESLRALAPNAVVHVFFANGVEGGPAAVEHHPNATGEAVTFEPLSRVFGQTEANRLVYRPHRVEPVDGGTEAGALLPALGRQLSELRPGDQGMIIYNGHGSWAPDRAGNGLRLWGESSVDVREFEALLGRVHPEVPIRFVFTQCYSGAFERAVHPGASESLELAAGQRCGFFAESEDRLSEGCSASIRIGDYRDYTTYFFAALTGRRRTGESVGPRLDWDEDGAITPFDAHLYALVEGRNADLPRSTSEVFLDRWQPWYLRWVGTDALPDNVYGRAAVALAERIGFRAGGASTGAALEERYRTLVGRMESRTRHQQSLESRAVALQARIQNRLSYRWPTLSSPYTAAFTTTLAHEIADISNAIRADDDYPELLSTQEDLEGLTVELVELDRDISELDKLRRTRMLARALDQIERRGSASALASYRQLRSCESLPVRSGSP